MPEFVRMNRKHTPLWPENKQKLKYLQIHIEPSYIEDVTVRGRSFDFLGGARFFFEKNCLSHDLSKKNKLLANTVEKNCLFNTHGKLFLLQNKKKIVCVCKKREKKDCRCSSRKKNVCREIKNLAPPRRSNDRPLTLPILLVVFKGKCFYTVL